MNDNQGKHILLKTIDGAKTSLWKYKPETSVNNGQHIFLGHGTFCNKKICLGIAQMLLKQGYTCWIVEWRGHGSSPEPKAKYSFETVGKYDLKAVFDYLKNEEGLSKISCITHSSGGFVLTMFLCNHPAYQTMVQSVVMFSCQTSYLVHNFKSWFKMRASWLLCKILGRMPAKSIGLGDHAESYYMMNTWYQWNFQKHFIGEEGMDYVQEMAKIQIPILAMAGKGDTFIAPPRACKAFYANFTHQDNQFLIPNEQEAYTHSRIFYSRSAEKETWQQALNWVEKYN